MALVLHGSLEIEGVAFGAGEGQTCEIVQGDVTGAILNTSQELFVRVGGTLSVELCGQGDHGYNLWVPLSSAPANAETDIL